MNLPILETNIAKGQHANESLVLAVVLIVALYWWLLLSSGLTTTQLLQVWRYELTDYTGTQETEGGMKNKAETVRALP